jgi:hypothetical protein
MLSLAVFQCLISSVCDVHPPICNISWDALMFQRFAGGESPKLDDGRDSVGALFGKVSITMPNGSQSEPTFYAKENGLSAIGPRLQPFLMLRRAKERGFIPRRLLLLRGEATVAFSQPAQALSFPRALYQFSVAVPCQRPRTPAVRPSNPSLPGWICTLLHQLLPLLPVSADEHRRKVDNHDDGSG